MPSPLLGPSSFEPLASVLADRGVEAAIADVRPAFAGGSPVWPEMVRLARKTARSVLGKVVVVGHSGAGALLPGVGAALGGQLQRLVFVDAILPPAAGAHRYPESIRRRVAELATDGVLPPWLDWWPPETLSALLPEPARLELLRSDIAETPESWFDEEIPIPIAWADGKASYIRLSAAYDQELERARGLGWPTMSLESTHLGIVTEPEAVADVLFGPKLR